MIAKKKTKEEKTVNTQNRMQHNNPTQHNKKEQKETEQCLFG